MSLERIVRPFQSEDLFTARRLAPPLDSSAREETPPEDVVITISSRADTEYVDEPPPWALGFQSEWVEDKSKRITDRVRVENPDDAEQYVMIERIKNMTLRNTKTGEQFPIKPDWST